MPSVIDPFHMHVDDLPGVWSPVQWELSREERVQEIETQARAYDPPEDYDPEQQGEWASDVVTFQFKRAIRLAAVEREANHLFVEYDFGELGRWVFEIDPEKVTISRI